MKPKCVTTSTGRRASLRTAAMECARVARLALVATWIAVFGRGCEVGTCDDYEAAASGEYSVRNAGPLCLTHGADMEVDLDSRQAELLAAFQIAPDRSCSSRAGVGTIHYRILEFRRHVQWDETW